MESTDTRLVPTLLEMLSQDREPLSYQVLDYLLIHLCTVHVLEVVYGKDVLHYTAECPKGFLLRHNLEQSRHNEIEPLAVPNVRVPDAVSSAHSLYGIKHLLAEFLF